MLSSLGNARQKANDAKAEAQLASMRSQAELYYNSDGDGTYGIPTTGPGTDTSCSDGNTGTLFLPASDIAEGGSPNGLGSLIASLPSGYTVSCYTNPSGGGFSVATGWAVTAQNSIPPAPYTASWCVDSTGQSKSYGASLIAPVDAACQ